MVRLVELLRARPVGRNFLVMEPILLKLFEQSPLLLFAFLMWREFRDTLMSLVKTQQESGKEMTTAINALREAVNALSQRLAHLEGQLAPTTDR